MVTINYDRSISFVKQDNLMQYFRSNQVCHPIEYYAETRKIRLILLVRYEKGRIYAKIKCPINPLPVRGEFEIPSLTAIFDFLTANGWIPKEDMNLHMFN